MRANGLLFWRAKSVHRKGTTMNDVAVKEADDPSAILPDLGLVTPLVFCYTSLRKEANPDRTWGLTKTL